MGFFKRIRNIVHPVAGMMDRQKATAGKLKARDQELANYRAQNDPQTQLNSELENYKNIGNDSMASATDQAKKNGTYADTMAGRTALQGEADAQARFGRRASMQKINSLQKTLGLTETPQGQL